MLFSKRVKENVESIFIVLGIMGAGFLAFRTFQRHAGFFSYAGLSPEQVDKTAHEFDQRCKIFSRAVKQTPHGPRYRGVYLGGACAFPIYYHYQPGKEFSYYPILWEEVYSSNKDIFDLTGKYIFP
jgi:hypothetical protein